MNCNEQLRSQNNKTKCFCFITLSPQQSLSIVAYSLSISCQFHSSWMRVTNCANVVSVSAVLIRTKDDDAPFPIFRRTTDCKRVKLVPDVKHNRREQQTVGSE